MMEDFTGQTFHRWTVLKPGANSNTGLKRYLCRCFCGTTKLVRAAQLKNGTTKSCGCFKLDKITKHGVSKRPGKVLSITYESWCRMRGRCNNPNDSTYHRYGGRGIKICRRWNNFENFLKDMGKRPSLKHSLDRKNNDKGYYKSNCKWSTVKEQANNRRTCVKLRYKGKNLTIMQWSERLGISHIRLYSRHRNGFKIKDILYVGKLTDRNRT
jgi:hypothetical protein